MEFYNIIITTNNNKQRLDNFIFKTIENISKKDIYCSLRKKKF